MVTGTSTGIGEDTAKLLASKGWTVFAGVRKEADADRLQSLDSNIRPLILDVTKQDQIEAAFAEVGAAVGEDGLDALVNNAALAISGPGEFTPISEFQRQYDINLFGIVRVTQAAMSLLRKGTPGRIVNVSSLAPQINMPFGGLYCSTKGALDSFSECFGREVMKWGIKVSVLKPGPVKTSFLSTATEMAKEVKEGFEEGSQCLKYYGSTMLKFLETVTKLNGIYASLSCSSAVIYGALTARFPRFYCYDTWGTYFTAVILNWMPTFFADKLILYLSM